MGDFFKSAIGYLASPAVGKSEHDFVGQFIEVGSQTLKIKRVIAEGGFAVVFEAVDSTNGKEYALKRLLSHDEATSKVILQEISILKRLCGHPHIVQFISAASVGQERSRHVGTEFLIVTEMCHGGQLVDQMRKNGHAFPVDVILKAFYQTCKAVQHLHKQDPPIIHRDLKVENLLLSSKGLVKLCDFGSCTMEQYFPDNSWTALKRSLVQDEFEKNTTPMYRAPELMDLYQNYPITVAMDIWALGCVLYYLCYNVHPFEDSAKLAILNANYHIPAGDSDYALFHNLIRQMLLIDPRQRPSINDILGELQELGSSRNVTLTAPPFGSKSEPSATSAHKTPPVNASPNRPPPPRPVQAPSNLTNVNGSEGGSHGNKSLDHRTPARPSPPQQSPATPQSSGTPAGSSMFGMLKGGAGSLMKNIKDASNKVLETVSASIVKSDMDFSYITSRIAVMSFPAETGIESITHNRIDDVQSLLDVRHPRSYAVYNVSLRPYRADRFESRLSQRGFEPTQAPPLRDLFDIMLNMLSWLTQGSDNICVVHCMDGKAASATVACSFLCLCRLFHQPMDALRMFMQRRCEPVMQPSQIRYVGYICDIVGGDRVIPHNRPVTLLNITISPVPLFNKLKNGCRPYVEIFRGNKRVYSTLQDYESMRGYTIEDKSIVIPLHGVTLMGDVVIQVHHARQSFATKGKISALKICQVQFHSGFIQGNQTKLHFEKCDLDHVDSSDRYPHKFHLDVDLTVSSTDNSRQSKETDALWENLPWNKLRPELLFSDKEEMRITVEQYGQRVASNKLPPATDKEQSSPSQAVKNPPPTVMGQKQDFFTSLVWDGSQPGKEMKINEIYAMPQHETQGVGQQQQRQQEDVADLLGFSIDEPDSPRHSQPKYAAPNNTETTNDEFTLLDFNESPPSYAIPPVPTQNKKENSFDPFAKFLSPESNTQNFPHTHATGGLPEPAGNIFDPFAVSVELDDANTPTLLKPSVVLPRNATSAHDLRSVQKNLPASCVGNVSKTDDPFSDLGSLLGDGMKLNAHRGALLSELPPAQAAESSSAAAAAASRPVMGSGYRFGGGGSHQNLNAATANSLATAATAAPKKITPEASPSHRPTPTVTSGIRPKVADTAFGEFLLQSGVGGSAFNAPPQPKTMKDMRREQMVKETDPNKLKVNDWIDGKERNIRALLCSLNTILWEGVRWKGVNMAELVSVDHVKRQYKNAIRCIHQDKWMGTEYEDLSKLITIELNDAMTEFEEEKVAAESSGRRMF